MHDRRAELAMLLLQGCLALLALSSVTESRRLFNSHPAPQLSAVESHSAALRQLAVAGAAEDEPDPQLIVARESMLRSMTEPAPAASGTSKHTRPADTIATRAKASGHQADKLVAAATARARKQHLPAEAALSAATLSVTAAAGAQHSSASPALPQASRSRDDSASLLQHQPGLQPDTTARRQLPVAAQPGLLPDGEDLQLPAAASEAAEEALGAAQTATDSGVAGSVEAALGDEDADDEDGVESGSGRWLDCEVSF